MKSKKNIRSKIARHGKMIYHKTTTRLNRWFEGQTKEIQHFCFGFNPGAKLSGKIMGAERVFGYISIGIGKYPCLPWHTNWVCDFLRIAIALLISSIRFGLSPLSKEKTPDI